MKLLVLLALVAVDPTSGPARWEANGWYRQALPGGYHFQSTSLGLGVWRDERPWEERPWSWSLGWDQTWWLQQYRNCGDRYPGKGCDPFFDWVVGR